MMQQARHILYLMVTSRIQLVIIVSRKQRHQIGINRPLHLPVPVTARPLSLLRTQQDSRAKQEECVP